MERAAGYDVVIGAAASAVRRSGRLARRGYRVVMVGGPSEFGWASRRLGSACLFETPRPAGRAWPAQGKATVKGGAICTSSAQPGVEAELGFHPVFRALMTLVGRAKPTIHANRELIDIDLIEGATKAGVTLIQGKVKKIEREGERVAGVLLEDGRRLEGRFYVDATGSVAMFRRAFGIGEQPIGPRMVVVRARFPHAYDGMGTRIRTDDTLGSAAGCGTSTSRTTSPTSASWWRKRTS
jgi:hypothetical protein